LIRSPIGDSQAIRSAILDDGLLDRRGSCDWISDRCRFGGRWSRCEELAIVDLVDHAVIADPDPPEVDVPLELLRSLGTSVVHEAVDRRADPPSDRASRFSSCFAAAGVNWMVFATV